MDVSAHLYHQSVSIRVRQLGGKLRHFAGARFIETGRVAFPLRRGLPSPYHDLGKVLGRSSTPAPLASPYEAPRGKARATGGVDALLKNVSCNHVGPPERGARAD
jgi:hypothetical protein